MEAVALIVEITALLTGTKCSEVFCSSGYGIGEELKDYASSLEAIFTLLTNGDIKVGLRVFRVEVWKPRFITNLLRRVFIVVNTFVEESCKAGLSFLVLCCLLLLDDFVLLTQSRISRVNLDGGNDISHRIIKLIDLGARDRA